MLSITLLDENNTNDLHKLRHDVLRAPLGLNLFEEDLHLEKNQIAFGAFINHQLVGCLMLLPINNSIKLRQMAVAEALQGNGIGTLLMRISELWVKEKGYNGIILHARKTAEIFYLKLGYQIIGANFLEVGISHIKMQKLFNPKAK